MNHQQIQLHIEKGRELFQDQSFEEAFRELSLAVSQLAEEEGHAILHDEEVAELYALRGSALAAQDRTAALNDEDVFAQIMDDYDQALELFPYHVLYLNLRGEMYLNCGFLNYAMQAKEDFAHAVEQAPEDPASLRNLGEASFKMDNIDDALYNLSLAIEHEPSAEAFRLRALSYLKQRPPNFEAACSDLGQAIKLDPEREDLYTWRSQTWQELGRLDEAVREYDRVIAVAPEKAEYYVERGTLMLEADPVAARDDFDRALSIEENALAYNNRAYFFFMQGDYQAAISDAQQALQVDASCSIAFATLAEVYAKLEEREKMYAFLRLAVEEYYTDIVDVMSDPTFMPFQGEKEFQDIISSGAAS
ncbi:MAG: hypothetical protein AAF206_16320 [Bacteroidota bacterium]